MEPMSPALAAVFLSPAPPGKDIIIIFNTRELLAYCWKPSAFFYRLTANSNDYNLLNIYKAPGPVLGGKDIDRQCLYFRPQGAKYLCANFILGFLPLFSVSSTLSIIFSVFYFSYLIYCFLIKTS